ncbi:MAG: FecR domain-containing protein [Treponemataceae bacterium]|nr:FecR domain-containing protein [Treponemataceae bacterium]
MTSKKIIALCACILVLASSAFALTGKIVSVSGKVEVQNGSRWMALSAGDELDAGAVISTGFKSEAILKIGESVITVKALTRLTLETLYEQNGDNASSVYLDAGSINASVRSEEDKRVSFKVKTPAVTASVRGTDGDITVNKVVGTSGVWLLTAPEPKAIVYNSANPLLSVQSVIEEANAAAAAEAAVSGDSQEEVPAESTSEQQSASDAETAAPVETTVAVAETAVTESASEETEAADQTGTTADEAVSSEAVPETSAVSAEASAPAATESAAESTAPSASAEAAPATSAATAAETAAPEVDPFPANNNTLPSVEEMFSSLYQPGGVIVKAGETAVTTTNFTGGVNSISNAQTVAASQSTSTGSVALPSTSEAVAPVAPVEPAPETAASGNSKVNLGFKFNWR